MFTIEFLQTPIPLRTNHRPGYSRDGLPVVKHRQLARQVGVLGALRSRARWTSKSRFVAPPYSRSASASIRASTRPLRQHLLRLRQLSEILIEARLYHVPTTRQPASNMPDTSTSRTATQTPSQLSYMRIQVQLRHKKSPTPTRSRQRAGQL